MPPAYAGPAGAGSARAAGGGSARRTGGTAPMTRSPVQSGHVAQLLRLRWPQWPHDMSCRYTIEPSRRSRTTSPWCAAISSHRILRTGPKPHSAHCFTRHPCSSRNVPSGRRKAARTSVSYCAVVCGPVDAAAAARCSLTASGSRRWTASSTFFACRPSKAAAGSTVASSFSPNGVPQPSVAVHLTW